MGPDLEKIIISQEQLENRVQELGKQLTKDYQDKQLIVIGILRGATIFLADLVREIDLQMEIDFMAVSSYGLATKSSGVVRIIKDLESTIAGRDVLIVEDIVDSGLTLKYIVENLQSRKPNSIEICTLLDKPARRVEGIDVKYNGFVIPDEFVVGYGLDYAERYRNLPYIGVLKPEIYTT
ncbi:MAG: hypoxanthine phosphoribosyltransferase [Firmicutes bacterium]|nr:hypoxanthine phosphoribosyltransferase [Bacillota bacterium]MDD4263049.1 hypoxanthine phosphoribosyltransferase [Bacillota bacterium]MDD4692802.1 hypoxanthine phosphoribosyltransferase [Bacillota bacterium]